MILLCALCTLVFNLGLILDYFIEFFVPQWDYFYLICMTFISLVQFKLFHVLERREDRLCLGSSSVCVVGILFFSWASATRKKDVYAVYHISISVSTELEVSACV